MATKIDPDAFVDFEFTRGKYRVCWEYIGEGNSGDYDEEDPNDQPLLRFSCDVLRDEAADSDGWEGLADASYCTQLNTDTPIPVLLAAAWEIMQALELPSYKRRLEQLTWMEFRNGALQVPA